MGSAGVPFQDRGYAYRPDGHPTAVDEALGGLLSFTLDAGNQTSASWPTPHPDAEAATGPRAYTGNRVTGAGGVRYEYDAQGRVVLRRKTRLSRKPDTWRYEWDVEDRLVGVRSSLIRWS